MTEHEKITETPSLPDLDSMTDDQIIKIHDQCHTVIEERAGKPINAARARKARDYRAALTPEAEA